MARNTAEPIVIEGNTGTALADFAEIERQALAQMQQRIQAPSGNGISIRDKQFKFPDGRVADSLNVVVLDFVTRNLYYVGRFDPKNPAPPTCFAIGKDLKTLKPSANSADVQNEAGCATCENNTFGSNGAAKACKNTRLLAVLEVGEDYATAPIYTISVLRSRSRRSMAISTPSAPAQACPLGRADAYRLPPRSGARAARVRAQRRQRVDRRVPLTAARS